MSSIQSNSAAVRGLLGLRREVSTPQPAPQTPQGAARRGPQSSDAALMHAWSIGTTRAAQQPGGGQSEKNSAQTQSDCPPEVYIG